MSETKDRKIWKIVSGTVIACAAVFGFIYKHTVDSYQNRIQTKDDTIELLEGENKRLTKEGPVPEAVRKLETQINELRNQLRPLTMVTQIDQITGRCKVGMMNFDTRLTSDMSEAQKLIEEKKFDLALQKAQEMEKKLPDFVGVTYVRFLINKAKDYKEEAAKLAETILEKLPNDKRLEHVYVFLANYYLSKNKKQKAEQITIRALSLWPDDEELKDSFERIFGYRPTIVEKID